MARINFQNPAVVVFRNGEMDYETMARLQSFNCSFGVYGAPGTATMNLVSEGSKRGKTADWMPELVNKMGECSLWSAMDEIEVWASGQMDSRSWRSFYPIFWGLVKRTPITWSDGVTGVTIDCADILHWLEMTRVNIGYDVATEIEKQMGSKINAAYANKFQRNTTQELFQDILLSATTGGEFIPSGLVTFDTYYGGLGSAGGSAEAAAAAYAEKIKAMSEEKQRETAVNLVTYADDGSLLIPDKVAYDIWQRRKEIRAHWIKRGFGRLENRLQFFSEDTALVCKPIEIDTANANFDYIRGNFMTRMEFAMDIASKLQYEFFMDPSGDIVLKPPTYNMPAVNAIHPEEVANGETIPIDLDMMVTMITAFGRENRYKASESVSQARLWATYAPYGDATEIENITGVERALAAEEGRHRYNVSRYGIRSPMQITNPLLRTVDECKAFALWKFDQHNADVCRRSVTLRSLRPDIRMGFPIIDYRDLTVWYVKRVTHDINPSAGTASTTLDLNARRMPVWKSKDGVEELTISPEAGARFQRWEKYGAYIPELGFQYGGALKDDNPEQFRQKQKVDESRPKKMTIGKAANPSTKTIGTTLSGAVGGGT